MPEPDVDYKVQIAVKNYTWTSEVPKERNGQYTRWGSRSENISWKLPKNPHSTFTREENSFKNRYRNEYRLYIYLLDESDIPICFYHCDLSDFRELNA